MPAPIKPMNVSFRILRRFAKYNLNQTLVAIDMGVTPVTMRKFLRASGLTYQDVLDYWRCRMVERLTAQGKTKECILHEIGYSKYESLLRFWRSVKGEHYEDYRKRVLPALEVVK